MTEPTYGIVNGHHVHDRTIDHFSRALSRKNLKATVARVEGVNAKIGLSITLIVGNHAVRIRVRVPGVRQPSRSPERTEQGHTLAAIAWLSQTFFQLVLLPIMIVGQNLQNAAADARAAKTFADVETVKEVQALALDRLDEHTAGGIKTVLDCIDGLSARLPGPAA